MPEISPQEINDFEQSANIKVYQASAKSGQNVEATFLALTQTLIDKYKPQPVTDGSYQKPGEGNQVLFT